MPLHRPRRGVQPAQPASKVPLQAAFGVHRAPPLATKQVFLSAKAAPALARIAPYAERAKVAAVTHSPCDPHTPCTF